MSAFCITDEGRKAVRGDTSMSAEQRLCAEIVARCPAIDGEDLDSIMTELVQTHGDATEALVAVLAGDVSFEEAPAW